MYPLRTPVCASRVRIIPPTTLVEIFEGSGIDSPFVRRGGDPNKASAANWRRQHMETAALFLVANREEVGSYGPRYLSSPSGRVRASLSTAFRIYYLKGGYYRPFHFVLEDHGPNPPITGRGSIFDPTQQASLNPGVRCRELMAREVFVSLRLLMVPPHLILIPYHPPPDPPKDRVDPE